MLYRITHTTEYEYAEPVSLCQNLACLVPREVPRQRCLRTRLTITPEPAVLTSRTDYFGNTATYFTIQEPHRHLTLVADHDVELTAREEIDPRSSPPWEQVCDELIRDRTAESLQAYQFVFGSRYARPERELLSYAAPSFVPGRPLVEAVLDLTRRIHEDFLYDARATNISTPVSEVFANRRGVCQDFAHLQISALRSFGLAARYVSGYLCTNPPPGSERLVGADATHAWLSVYCPKNGWIDFDPTNNQIPSDKHIMLAWGRDYDDVSPIKGVILGGGRHAVQVGVDVRQIRPNEPSIQ